MNQAAIDQLSQLPVDVFIQQITYLPFKDVVSVCSANQRLRNFCTNLNYSTNWKRLIDNTFQNTVEGYQDKLNQLWNKLGSNKGTYNYLVYTQLVKLLDPVTQGMIYYLQGDMESFNQLTQRQKFLAMFLLKKSGEMQKYLPNDNYLPFITLLQGDKLDQTDLDRMLIEMAMQGNLKGVKYLVEQGADIHARNEEALILASKNGQLDVVKYLVEQGANVHARDDSALQRASSEGHLDVVKYLVEQGVDIHAYYDFALREASRYGRLDVVKYLVEQGADIHADYDDALRRASRKGHLDVVKYLVEQGAHGARAMKWASENGQLDVVKYLVELYNQNFFIDLEELLVEASENGHLDVVKYLVEQGAEVDFGSLYFAIENGHLNVVKYLVEQGAEINPVDVVAPLIIASEMGNLNIVKYLVEKGGEISSSFYEDQERLKALKRSRRKDHLDIVKYLEDTILK